MRLFVFFAVVLTLLCLPGALLADGNSAEDAADHSVYVDGWQTGDNGGSGFGPWVLRSSSEDINQNGFFIGSSTGNGSPPSQGIDTATNTAWGLYANNGASSVAYRTLDRPASQGDFFEVYMDGGMVQASQTVGVVFRSDVDSSSDRAYDLDALLAFYQVGGSNNYFVADGDGVHDTGVPVNDDGIRFFLRLQGGRGYLLRVFVPSTMGSPTKSIDGRSLSGNASVRSVALFNRNAGSGSPSDVFFNRLRVFDFKSTHYVSLDGGNRTPFKTWEDAATSIQAAIDVASDDGDVIMVSNGVYSVGTRTTSPRSLSNRVHLTPGLSLVSAFGPEVTEIVGAGPVGPSAVRPVLMEPSTRLVGFTIRDGATLDSGFATWDQAGGGIWADPKFGAVVSNCVIRNCSANYLGGGIYGATVYDSVVHNNSSSDSGGGHAYGEAYRTTVVSNTASGQGGGTYFVHNYSGEIGNNSAFGRGGGAAFGSAISCDIHNNSSRSRGGGLLEVTAQSSFIHRNQAQSGDGGGASGGLLQNCTLIQNQARQGGGVHNGQIENSIVYFNHADVSGPNWFTDLEQSWQGSVTTPLPPAGGAETGDPGLASLDGPHILDASVCRKNGSYSEWMESGLDIDGEPRLAGTSVDIGCDQFHALGAIDALSVAILASHTNVSVGAEITFSSVVSGRAHSIHWNWGDGDTSADLTRATHRFTLPGDYTVTLTASNALGSASGNVAIHVDSTLTTYVSLDGSNMPPFTSWAMAATNIQDAIDIHTIAGGVVIVSNGVYRHGRGMNSELGPPNEARAFIDKVITVRSLNGPLVTTIVGENAAFSSLRCAYVGAGARLEGFTLTGARTPEMGFDPDFDEFSGGAVWCREGGVVERCIMTGNQAYKGGGALLGGLARNCLIYGNSAFYGGGAYYATLEHCTVVGNRAMQGGGGIFQSHARNCIIYDNEDVAGGENWSGLAGSVEFSCTIPLPQGPGNFTNSPMLASIETPHLLAGSPCIDAGDDEGVSSFDFDGDARIIGRGTDVGFDEFNGPAILGGLSATIAAPYTNAVVGFPLVFSAHIDGPVLGADWSDSDGAHASGHASWRHAFSAAGEYVITLSASNHSAYVFDTVRVTVVDAYTNYVSAGGAHLAPFTSLAHAATNLQAAINANMYAGGTVSVAPGIYSEGGTVAENLLTNLVFVRNPVHVLSSGGPSVTELLCAGFMRGAWIGRDAQLSGFTIRTGNAQALSYPQLSTDIAGGGTFCDIGGVVSNCVILNCNAGWYGGGVFGGDVVDSTIMGCYANYSGGGTFGANLLRSIVVSNSCFEYGGGAFGGEHRETRFEANDAGYDGGGVAEGTSLQCVLIGNHAESGGGIFKGSAEDCSFFGNRADVLGGGVFEATGDRLLIVSNISNQVGGGAARSTIRNSLIITNRAPVGGGTYLGVVENCTITGNHASNGSGGGCFSGQIRNSIIYFNTDTHNNDPRPNVDLVFATDFSLENSCTTPDSDGPGVVHADPRFDGSADNPFRLASSSPCIDRAQNYDWMENATDIAGNPRIRNRSADMGAYEFAFKAQFHANLEGPWLGGDLMSPGALLPLTSPYAAHPRSIDVLPANMVDWVLVEVRETTNGTPVYVASGMLLRDGRVVADAEESRLDIETASGDFYVALKHRNHLAVMSAMAVSFTNRNVSYDFRLAGSHYGGSASASDLGGGRWGLMRGDVDGDGRVIEIDEAIALSHQSFTGYERSDLDLDGSVEPSEVTAMSGLVGARASKIPNPGVSLTNTLRLSPNRRTIQAGDSVVLSADSAIVGTGAGIGFTLNASQASLTPVTGSTTTYVYQAGSATGVVDVVEAWDSNDRLTRSFFNVISSADVAAAGKAIIVAGGKRLDDPVWLATDYVADKAYRVLRHRGFSRDNIQYLSFEPGQNEDLDGNGLPDDIDNVASLATLGDAFLNWVGSADKLFVFLANHGSDSAGEGFFRLSGSEIVSAGLLKVWLDAVQAQRAVDVTIVMDFCYSGSFLDEIRPAPGALGQRIVMSSAGERELTYFIAGGLVSFSDILFSALLQGVDFRSAFMIAKNGMSLYQTSLLDDNGNGNYEPLADGATAAQTHLGPSFISGRDVPSIGRVNGSVVLEEGTSATLWADNIDSFYPVERVWCSIIPPSHSPNTNAGIPVVDVPEVDLVRSVSSGRYEGVFDAFVEPGLYQVNFHARDIWDSVSLPKQSQVGQETFREKVLVAISGGTNSIHSVAYQRLARIVYATVKARNIPAYDIRLLSPVEADLDFDSIIDVDGPASLASLANAFDTWASDADRLTVFLVGDSKNSEWVVNDSESLSANTFNQWLDQFQTRGRTLNVVMEFEGAGGWISALRAPAGQERILIACTRENRPNVLGADGFVSFSRFFMSSIFQGKTIGDSFKVAKRTIRRASGRVRQESLIDDSGNGIANEKNVDGNAAAGRFLGPAFLTGDDVPGIGRVNPPTVLVDTNTLLLYAADVLDVDGISNVWCQISAPDYDGVAPLPRLDLNYNPGSSRWEATYTQFDLIGLYVLTFFAEDNLGELSDAAQTDITVSGPFDQPDIFEVDNTDPFASLYARPQVHSFHVSNDVDWVRFYALSNYVYDVETIHHGVPTDTVIDLYRQLPGGALQLIERVDSFGSDEGELTGLDFPEDGWYYVRVSLYDGASFEPAGYTLVIDVPSGGGQYIVLAVNAVDGSAMPAGTTANVDAGGAVAFNGSKTLVFDLPAGPHSVQISAPLGYIPVQSTVQPGQVGNPFNEVYGNPRNVSADDISIGASGFATFAFLPAITLDGRVRDAFTQGWIDGALLQFTASSGPINGVQFDRFPFNNTYTGPWRTAADGTFPTNVMLIADETYTLTVVQPGYSNHVDAASLNGQGVGAHVGFGTFTLTPIDSDGNGVSDAWELLHLGGPLVPNRDTDGDGHDDLKEYRLGTIPTNAMSVLAFEPVALPGSGPVTLAWPVSAGRRYELNCTASLLTTNWTRVFGPWTAPSNGMQQWTDPASTGNGRQMYRIDVNLP